MRGRARPGGVRDEGGLIVCTDSSAKRVRHWPAAAEEQLSGGCVTQKLCQLLKERMERERHDMEDACDRMRLAFENK